MYRINIITGKFSSVNLEKIISNFLSDNGIDHRICKDDAEIPKGEKNFNLYMQEQGFSYDEGENDFFIDFSDIMAKTVLGLSGNNITEKLNKTITGIKLVIVLTGLIERYNFSKI